MSWLPIHIVKEVVKKVYPSEEKKLMRDNSLKRDILGIVVSLSMICGIIYGYMWFINLNKLNILY